jgi:lysophospholipase L1-like esterase
MPAKGLVAFRSKYWLSFFVLFFTLVPVGCGSGTTGNSSSAPTWQYAALGDSLAAGALAQLGYVPRYATYVNTDTGSNVTTLNLGIPGWHSGDLLNALQNDPIFQNQVSGAEIVTWDIGGNDLANAHDSFVQKTCGGTDNQDCLRTAVATFQTNWDAIIAELLKLRAPSKTNLRTMDIYNPYVAADTASGIFTTIEPYLDQVNSHIQTTAQTNGIPVAAVHLAFNGAAGTQDPIAAGLIASDSFHPNDAGHKLIADQLRTLLYKPLH